MKKVAKIALLALTTGTTQAYQDPVTRFVNSNSYNGGSVKREADSGFGETASPASLVDKMFDTHQLLIDKLGIGHMKDMASKAWNVWHPDAETTRLNSKMHSERGGARSGMGTPEQSAKRERMFAERQRIEEMFENNEKPTDIGTANKLIEFNKEKQANRPGLRQDDR